ncbi:MAG: VPLPA-CTERM-specific exosortase XrtD [Methylophaga sp.]|nr:VPLPA-CTERM-specific exosortase XrtD [Methylophaga sp.]
MSRLIWLPVLLVVLVFATYWDGLAELWRRWSVQPEYSHGFLIPLVVVYILWEKKALIRYAITPPIWSGLILLAVAMLMLLVGEISALYLFIHYSLIVFLIGASLLLLGKATRYTVMPLLLLCFAIPLPYVIEVVLTAKLQLVSSMLGVMLIRVCQIPVFLEGNVIDLGIYQLQVVEACSGLRYLFPLMSVGFIAAYFYQVAFWKRALVFLATIPITIFMNSLRIGVIGVLVDNWGISMAEGFLHDFEGWIIFMFCAAILALIILILEKITDPRGSVLTKFGVPDKHKIPVGVQPQTNVIMVLPVVILSLSLLAVFMVGQFLDQRTENHAIPKEFVNFPSKIDNWQGQHQPMDLAVRNSLGMTDYLLVNFFDKQDALVNLYVAYYQTQRKGVSPHSPKVCIPGGGWEITEFERIDLDGQPLNRVIIQKGQDSQLVYYWFEGRGRVIANEYVNKWYLLVDALTKNRTDGSLVRLVTPIYDGQDAQQADQRLQGFMQTIDPALGRFIID